MSVLACLAICLIEETGPRLGTLGHFVPENQQDLGTNAHGKVLP